MENYLPTVNPLLPFIPKREEIIEANEQAFRNNMVKMFR
jgi:hypothetical protein